MPNAEAFPIIRLELQGMKHTILKAFSESNEEIERAVDAALEVALKPENINKIVLEHIERQASEIISRLVNDSMTRLLWDDTLKEDVYALVRKSISRKMRGEMMR